MTQLLSIRSSETEEGKYINIKLPEKIAKYANRDKDWLKHCTKAKIMFP